MTDVNMFAKACVFLFTTIVVFCESAYVDSLKPCKIEDGKCQGALFQSVIQDIAETGLPEINLLPIDPMKLKELTVTVPDVLNLTLNEGTLKGIRHCRVVEFGTKIKDRHSWVDLICNVTFKSSYNLFSNTDFIRGVTGGKSIHGEGNGKAKIENLKIKLDFHFDVQKKNGEIYLIHKHDKTTYKYEFAGKVTFFADKLYIGNEESSKTLVALLNQNYNTMVINFGKYFMAKAIKIVTKFIRKFFDNVPARYYISDDLSAYLN